MDVPPQEKLSKDTYVQVLPQIVLLHAEIQKGLRLNNAMTGTSFQMMGAQIVLKTMGIIVQEQNRMFVQVFAEME